MLAVPLDNRHIKLYDLGGNRLANLPHRNRKVNDYNNNNNNNNNINCRNIYAWYTVYVGHMTST